MDFYIDPAMTSTPPTEHIKHTPTELELAAMIARRFGEPEPNYLSFDVRLVAQARIPGVHFRLERHLELGMSKGYSI